MKPIRYWFTFDLNMKDPHPYGALLGCGVTAYSKEDALDLIRSRVFAKHPFPPIRGIREDVDVSTLDPGHVLPNMGNVLRRGIWFPLGYDGPAYENR